MGEIIIFLLLLLLLLEWEDMDITNHKGIFFLYELTWNAAAAAVAAAAFGSDAAAAIAEEVTGSC